MIIENARPKVIRFSLLNCGDCFRFNNSICLKTESKNLDNDSKINCVDLADGKFYYICNESEIVPVNTTVEIANCNFSEADYAN